MRSEFECNCGCGYDTVDVDLVKVLEFVREYYGKPVTITSGCRCESHNKKCGGSSRSQHLIGKAADFVVKGVSPEEVQYKLRMSYPSCYGIGRSTSFTHIDVRRQRADWTY